MYIERIQIEEGFLNGFDVWLRAGLNVLIGARGTGKTSLIELIRFCLDVPGYTPESTRRSRDHALSVLGSGQITLTLVDGARRVTVSRAASDAAPRASGPYLPPIVLSQTEIETVGLQPGGRLRLLDGFMGDQRALASAEIEAISEVRSLTAEANTIQQDIEQLRRQIAELPSIHEQLEQLAPQEQQVAGLSADAAVRTQQLNVITGTITVKSVATTVLQRFHAGVSQWRASLSAAQSSFMPNEAWPPAAGGDPLGQIRSRIAITHGQVNHVLNELAQIEAECAGLTGGYHNEKIAFEDNARQLRREIDGLQSGAGEIIRRGQLLRERKAQLESLQTVLLSRQAAMAQAIQRRSVAFDNLEKIRTQRFQARAQVAANLNQVLGPRIRLDVVRGGQTESFAAAITEALRGSGLKYTDIVGALAQRISPRELLEAVESDNYQLVAACGNTTPDRAAKASDRDVFLFLVDDTHPIEAGKLPNGEPDLYFRGFYCWNSEVGSKSLGIATFYLRAVCMNRNLWGVENFEEINIRHSKFAANRFAHEAAPALEHFADSSPRSFVDGIKQARERIVARKDDDREDFLRKRGFSKAETSKIITAVLVEEGHPPESLYDFVQGITAHARTKTNQDSRLELEGKARKLLERVN